MGLLCMFYSVYGGNTMETVSQKSPARPYDAPAVVYEANLIAHAGTTSVSPTPGCPLSGGDLLDPTQGKNTCNHALPGICSIVNCKSKFFLIQEILPDHIREHRMWGGSGRKFSIMYCSRWYSFHQKQWHLLYNNPLIHDKRLS